MFKNYTGCFTDWAWNGAAKWHSIVKAMLSFFTEPQLIRMREELFSLWERWLPPALLPLIDSAINCFCEAVACFTVETGKRGRILRNVEMLTSAVSERMVCFASLLEINLAISLITARKTKFSSFDFFITDSETKCTFLWLKINK